MGAEALPEKVGRVGKHIKTTGKNTIYIKKVLVMV